MTSIIAISQINQYITYFCTGALVVIGACMIFVCIVRIQELIIELKK
jgi:hypothetical protein